MKKIISLAATLLCCAGMLLATSCKKEKPVVKPMSFNPTNIEVEVGATAEVTVSEAEAPLKATSNNNDIATAEVNAGKITVKGIAAGSAVITVKDKNDKTGTFSVTVKAQQEEKPMVFDPAEVEVEVGATAEVTVSEAETPLTATSSDDEIATVEVNDGKITVKGIAVGSAVITVKDKNDKTGTFPVIVKTVPEEE